ncbi:pyridoxamine 5'-phosphate oxidase family protein (plasmid) [Rhizobium sp. TH2]|uniref:pyridoxamine 5'-phosphate oxidase family protein n=1 Tax=Rhizobium sp. TH2 TaxID=2775403 RepID=UPI00215736C5|nr:pyridoxamine 5'-phosphate oxidase family protein [Rhizobium sp. TH2]UVC12383.1 pyridoxamine 5'-phosphate oxidase family protein [Rhizobium sp. TH2]
MNIKDMSDSACVAFIESQRIGRLGCCKDGRPYVVPITFVCSNRLIYSFSMPGQKLEFMRSNPVVCLEVENIERRDKWQCAVVQGLFHEFTGDDEKQQAWKILQRHNDWWEVGGQVVHHGDKDGDRTPTYYSISMDVVTGRQALA